METASDYYTAWWTYLGAVAGAQFLLWWLIRKLTSSDIKLVLHIVLFSILITPATMERGVDYWVPAFMVAILDGFTHGIDTVIPRLWPILIVMLALISVSFLFKLVKARMNRKQLETS